MNKVITFFCFSLFLFSCKKSGRESPDTSKIKAPLEIIRYERTVFANGSAATKMDALDKKYPAFTKDFLFNIVGIPPQKDSIIRILPLFVQSNRVIYDSVQAIFTDSKLNEILAPLQKALKLTKYYFPQYKLPNKLFTYVGPLDGYGSIMTSSGLAIGLQSYLGANFQAYHTDYLQQVYPNYISARFEPEYISVNSTRNIVEDLFMNQAKSTSLVEQMVDLGKKLYVMDYLLPDVPENLIFGYTEVQLENVEKNEALIWNFFLQNNLLYSTEADNFRDYLNDGPNTPALGSDIPGNIGQFTGLQIVKKWMNEHPKKSLSDLLNIPSSDIFKETKYKPH